MAGTEKPKCFPKFSQLLCETQFYLSETDKAFYKIIPVSRAKNDHLRAKNGFFGLLHEFTRNILPVLSPNLPYLPFWLKKPD